MFSGTNLSNNKLMDYLLFYNTPIIHRVFTAKYRWIIRAKWRSKVRLCNERALVAKCGVTGYQPEEIITAYKVFRPEPSNTEE